jgi:peptidoglycan hydrolase-like protein with peptidoglycan-binding domain
VCRAFQQEKNITADGKVGPVTWGESWTSPVT